MDRAKGKPARACPWTNRDNATAQHFEIGDVMADKGYMSRNNFKVVAAHGGTPYIPFRTSVIQPELENSTWSKMYHLFAYQRDAWMEHYGRRQCVESAFSRIKAKFGHAVRGKTTTTQVNEVLAKVLCHNISVVIRAMHELEVEPAFASMKTA